MSNGQFAYLLLVLASFGAFVVAVGYAYASSLQVRRARKDVVAAAPVKQTVTYSPAPPPLLRKAA